MLSPARPCPARPSRAVTHQPEPVNQGPSRRRVSPRHSLQHPLVSANRPQPPPARRRSLACRQALNSSSIRYPSRSPSRALKQPSSPPPGRRRQRVGAGGSDRAAQVEWSNRRPLQPRHGRPALGSLAVPRYPISESLSESRYPISESRHPISESRCLIYPSRYPSRVLRYPSRYPSRVIRYPRPDHKMP